MITELSYNTLALVLDSWSFLKISKDLFDETGQHLFQKLFSRSPEIKLLFGFPPDLNPDSEDLLHNMRFIRHSLYMMEMLDSALNLVGPDIELLTEILHDLGSKHVRYGVQPEMFPVMGECLIESLKDSLGEKFDDRTREAWEILYQGLSQEMIWAQTNTDR